MQGSEQGNDRLTGFTRATLNRHCYQGTCARGPYLQANSEQPLSSSEKNTSLLWASTVSSVKWVDKTR